MKDLVSGNPLLDQWRALAKVENARARQAWGFAGATGWPDDHGSGSALLPEARAERNAQVRTLSAAGRSIRQISHATGVPTTTVSRILRQNAQP